MILIKLHFGIDDIFMFQRAETIIIFNDFFMLMNQHALDVREETSKYHTYYIIRNHYRRGKGMIVFQKSQLPRYPELVIYVGRIA